MTSAPEILTFPPGVDSPWSADVRRLLIKDFLNTTERGVTPRTMRHLMPTGEEYTYCGIAEDDALIALGIIAAPEPLERPESFFTLKTLVVAQEYRSKGYGTCMLHGVEDVASSLGASGMKLYAKGTSRRFYHGHGYRPSPLGLPNMQKRLRTN